MKKFLSAIALFGLSLQSIYAIDLNSVGTTPDLTLTNNKGTVEMSMDTLLVGKVAEDVFIQDLFKSINIDGVEIIPSEYLKNLNVSFIDEKKVDFKVNLESDKITKNSDVFVFLKPESQGGKLKANALSTMTFELNKLNISLVGKASSTQSNSYTPLFNVKYTTGIVETENTGSTILTPELSLETNNEIDQVTNDVIDSNVLQENNTGIKSNLFIILCLMGITVFLFKARTKEIQ